ncbi:MAG TPA: PQQ-dependent sugar dehydrogenase [Nitrososphaeraceae archaeon]|nr:PQQ-dependent sugar dehydrogenase [Nitrososphaeraceae archaeon]
MIFKTIDKKAVFFINKNNLINLFIYTFLIFTIYNLVNYDLDDVLGKEKEQPLVYDKNIKITLFSEDLNFPTGIDFLGKNDMLVIEKNTGQVKRILNNEILIDPVLDLNIASESERGLLGLAISNEKDLTNFNNEKIQGNNLNNEIKVFLFYTETKNTDNGDILGNRLYTYDFVDGKLVNPKLLLDLPFLPGPSHNGGVLDLGPDNNLYLVVGDLNREANPEYMTVAQNIEDSQMPDGRGGVLRMTVEGNPVQEGNGFSLKNSDISNFYYGYGIRNSFGISFDPVTGILWETENGSNYGDEINVILSGFNGGWRQVLGLSSEYENFKNKIFDKNKLTLLNKKGTYYDPVFTWADTIAPTAITFINSKNFDEEYQNDLLVGSVKQGRIFHFNLNETRTGLDLPSEQLVDKMANIDEELDSVTFGRNFGIITDIEINPYDGNIYVVDGQSKNGKIYQLSKNLEQ